MVEITPMVCFHFYKQVARDMAPKRAVIFRQMVRGGSFPTCWRLADVPRAKGLCFLGCWRLQVYLYYAYSVKGI